MKSVAIIGDEERYGDKTTFWQPHPRQTLRSNDPSLSSSSQQNIPKVNRRSSVEEDDDGGTRKGTAAKQEPQQPTRYINGTVTQQKQSGPPTSKRRVVILPGPHKTASSSIQWNLLSWLNNTNADSDPSGLISKDWVWPTPIETIQKRFCIIDRKRHGQVFYWLINALMGKPLELHCLVDDGKKTPSKFDDTPGFIDIYRKEFYDMWKKGKNLVIASEAMDYIASENPSNHPDRLLDRFIHLLPWHYSPPPDGVGTPVVGSNDEITVVVMYRGLPRSSHLISIWHQCCMKDKSMTFYEYVTNPNWLKKWSDPIISIDSLKLAKKFVDKGFNVILIDMAGVQAKGYDISNVIACDVLEADCTNDKLFVRPSAPSSSSNNGGGTKNNLTRTKNVKQHSMQQLNVTSNQLQLIDNVIERYDCNCISLLEDKNFHVLYSYALKEVFQKCNHQNISGHNNSNHRMVNRKMVVKEIRKIFDV